MTRTRTSFFSRPGWIVAALGLMVHVPRTAIAQLVTVSPRLTAMNGDALAASAALRLEVGTPRVGAYGHVAALAVTQTCETSLPPTCSSPSAGGTELSGGLRVAFPSFGRTYPVISAGAGAFMWGDDAPYRSKVGLVLDFEGGLETALFSWADATMRLKLQRISQEVGGGMRLEADRGTYVGIVTGLIVPLRR